MGSGESSSNISSGQDELRDVQDSIIQFDNTSNPATNGSWRPPEYRISSTDSHIEDYPEMNFRELANTSTWNNTAPLTHGIHKHPAIFIPHIPRYIINRFTGEKNADGDRPTILDPFCGSGTTGVEAKVAGRDFLGIEINPLSRLVSKVATSPIPYTVIGKVQEELAERFAETEKQYYEEYDVEFLGSEDKSTWFQDEAIEGLTTVRKVIREFLDDEVDDYLPKCESRERKAIADLGEEEIVQRVNRWVTLMIANTVYEVSNADPGISKAYKSEKMKTLIKEGKHPRDPVEVYKEELEASGAELIDLWNEVYDMNAPGGTTHTVDLAGEENSTLHKFSENWVPPEENPSHLAEIDIRLDDAQSFSYPEYEGEVDLAITSPPYINAINYYRGTKLRLFWLQGLLDDVTDLDAQELRRSIVGSNSATIRGLKDELPYLLSDQWQGSWESFSETSLPDLDKDIISIHNSDTTRAEKNAYVTWKFFAEEMLSTLTNVYRHLKPGAYFFFVIGSNTISGRHIASHQHIADIATNLGRFSNQDEDISPDEGYKHVGTAWDSIKNRDLFQSRNHKNGVIEREWVVILQKPQ